MYAIFKTGGKQYCVSKGDIVFIERVKSNVEDVISFDEVLLINDDKKLTIGSPKIENAVVEAKVLKNGKSKKIHVFTYRPKKGSKRHLGHRQQYTKIQIESIKI